MTQAELLNVVFDLGGVLIDWNPRYLYRKLFPGDESAMERFLAEICSPDWNLTLDAGRPFAEAVAELAAHHPHERERIDAYHQRWLEMVAGPIEPTVRILEELDAQGRTVVGPDELVHGNLRPGPHGSDLCLPGSFSRDLRLR